MTVRTFVTLVVFATLLPLISVHAATITVTTLDDSGAGSLRQAIADAAPGDTIDFSNAVNGGIIRLTTGELVVNKAITIDASSLLIGITISGDADNSNDPSPGDSRVFNVSGDPVVLDGLTITEGKAPDVTTFSRIEGSGGGIHNTGTLTIRNCHVTQNVAGVGSAPIFLLGGNGGGIFNSGTLRVIQSTISHNTAGRGANETTRDTATGGGHGGGISSTGNLDIANSTIAHNRGGEGGTGTMNTDGRGGSGGALFSSGSATISSCTISQNSTGGSANNVFGSGGGVLLGTGASLSVKGSIIAQNDSVLGGADDLRNNSLSPVISNGFNIIGSNESVDTEFPASPSPTQTNFNLDFVGTAGSPFNAKLEALGDNGGRTPTMLPMLDSVAVDAESDGPLTFDSDHSTDQRGLPRLAVGLYPDKFGTPILDIGAVERAANVFMVTTAVDELDTPASSGTGISLREAIRDAPNGSIIRFNSTVFNSESDNTIHLVAPLSPSGSRSFAIDGEGISPLISISGQSLVRHFEIGGAANVELLHLLLVDGDSTSAASAGGSIRNLGGLWLRHCTINSCFSPGHAGAISQEGGRLVAVDTEFSANTAGSEPFGNMDGGAIRINGGSPVELLRCRIFSNRAFRNGGAIMRTGHASGAGSTIIDDCTFNGNGARSGGALFVGGSGTAYTNVMVSNTTFDANFTNGGPGGAIKNQGTLSLTNVTMHGNSSTDAGGAINNLKLTDAGNGNAPNPDSGQLAIVHSTITANSSGVDGTGVGGGIRNSGFVEIENSIVGENRSDPNGAGTADDISESTPGAVVPRTDLNGANIVETIPVFHNQGSGTSVSFEVDKLLGPFEPNGAVGSTRIPQVPLSSFPVQILPVFTQNTPSRDQHGAPLPRTYIGAVDLLPSLEFTIAPGIVRPVAGGFAFGWSGHTAGNYRVFLGTDPNNLAEVGTNNGQTLFDPGSLDSGKKYHYRVDSEFQSGVFVRGEVREFGTITPRPDSRVGSKANPARHRRDNVYSTGGGQKITVKMVGRRKGKAFASIQNDGDNVDRFQMGAIRASKRKMRLKTFQRSHGRANITAALKAGVYKTPLLQSGELVLLQSQAKAKKDRARQKLRFRASSELSPSISDTSIATLKQKPKRK